MERRARVYERRRVAYVLHALTLGLVVAGALAWHAVSLFGAGTESTGNVSRADDPPVRMPAADEAAPPPQAPAPPAPQFAPNVERWRPLSHDAAQTAQQVTGVNLDENIMLALVAVESGGKPAAHSSRGAVGLAQVEPTTFKDLRAKYGTLLGGGSLEQPQVNLLAGALYLAECARYLGSDVRVPTDLALVLHAYNMGPRAAAEWRDSGSWVNETDEGDQVERGLPAETVEHAARIMAAIHDAGM